MYGPMHILTTAMLYALHIERGGMKKKTLAAWYYFDGNNFLYDHLHVENAVYLGKYKDAQRLGQTRFSPHIYSEK